MGKPSTVQNERLGYLFELGLQFRWEMTPVTSREAGEGEYIGSGEGTVKGPRIHGAIRWDLFEKREATLLWRFGIQQPEEDQMGFLSNLFGGRATADKCSVCGSKFSATPSKSSDLMALVIAQRRARLRQVRATLLHGVCGKGFKGPIGVSLWWKPRISRLRAI